MSTTIFCTFDQQDIADLAMGDLRSTITGIKSIHYVNSFDSKPNIFSSSSSSAVNNSWAGLFPLTSAMGYDMPSRPVNVKIVCSDASARAVKSRLVNLRAYQIVTMR